MRFNPLLTAVVATLFSASSLAAEPASYRAGADQFAADMADKHGLDASEIQALLRRASYRQDIIDAMNRPYEGKPWHQYRRLFLTPERISGGVAFWRKNAGTLGRVESSFGVPPEVIVAIIGVETSYGGNVGKHRVLDALTTLGFSYPKRADFFRGELEEFLLLSRDEQVDPAAAVGSYAGALGKPQFIASSYRAYAVDVDGDGRRDLWNSDEDVIGSVANYFSRHGWRSGEPVAVPAQVPEALPSRIEIAEKKPLKPNTTAGGLRVAGVDWREPIDSSAPAALIRLDGTVDEYWVGLDNFYVITRYNHSNLYAMAVHQLSQEIRARYADGA